MRYMIFCALLFSLGSCSKDKRTQIFDNYLQQHYGVNIPVEKHSYVIFPRYVGCAGCSVKTYEFLRDRNIPNVSIICSQEMRATMPDDISYQVLVDSTNEIEHLNLETQNVGIIATNGQAIDSLVGIQSNNIENVLTSYFKPDHVLADRK